MPKLIVNGDDFGFSEGTNAGIMKAHHEGILTSTSVMINLDYAASGLEQLQQDAPSIGIGLHINLTHGKPVAPASHVSSLIDEAGFFHPIENILQVSGGYDSDELYEEIAAQIERFIALTGKKPTHLDSHYHIAFLHPLALEATLALAAEHGRLPLRESAFQNSTDKLIKDMQHFFPGIPDTYIQELIPTLQEVAANGPDYAMPARFETGFSGENITLGDLLVILADLPEERPTELLCHPGTGNDLLNPKATARQRELDALTHPTARELIDRYDISLISYADLANAK
ncbi:MAG: ChbG/HpnK family deacetylase [Chloroflexi bacterium]|nr:ChbG/HpnK family deacetylase [Chloroflexota bacterium]